MKALIQKLVGANAPAGFEAPVRDLVRAEITTLVDEVRVDALGNLIGTKAPTAPGGGTKILLAAHMDEIGVMAAHIEENGFVRFVPIGSVLAPYCPGARVTFAGGAQGVIGQEGKLVPDRLPTFETMYIDVGATSREDCPVAVGEPAAFQGAFTDLNGRLVAKALDNRSSVAVLIAALRRLEATPNEIAFVFSAQEEVGVRGAGVAAYGFDPDVALAVDTTPTGDTPRSTKRPVELGKGPAIKVRDPGMMADPRVVRWMVETAEGAGVPYQLEVLDIGSTDARAVQIVRGGVPAGCLSIPCRYVHTTGEMVDADDLERAVDLLVALLSQPILL